MEGPDQATIVTIETSPTTANNRAKGRGSKKRDLCACQRTTPTDIEDIERTCGEAYDSATRRAGH